MTHLKNMALREGRAHISDPIAHAKATQGGYANVAKRVEIHETPDSQPGLPGEKQYAEVNVAAKPNTYTGPGGSKRDD